MNIVRFLVQASGRKSRPSWSTSVKMGRNATAMTSSEKKTDGPTFEERLEANLVESLPGRLRSANARASCRRFSTSTIAPSTSTPIEMAMPASDMMLEEMPMKAMGMNASSTATGW